MFLVLNLILTEKQKFGESWIQFHWMQFPWINMQMGETKQINIKNRTYYFYNDQIDLKDFDAKLLKIDKKDYNEIFIILVMWLLKKLLIIIILIV